jgi:hypothetical protein
MIFMATSPLLVLADQLRPRGGRRYHAQDLGSLRSEKSSLPWLYRSTDRFVGAAAKEFNQTW